MHFNPRPLCRGRLLSFQLKHPVFQISIHALYAEGDLEISPTLYTNFISIHALYAEGDLDQLRRYGSDYGISIHALYAEGDLLFR